MPRASLLGIDLSPQQVVVGQHAIKAIGLANIELRAQSILDFDSDEQFDYIISHGVWSWVPQEVRQKIFDICHRNLSPSGVAYISYNTYPGWHMRGIVRDMMLFHARKFSSPKERVGHGRALLNFLANSTPKQSDPYALLLKSEAKLLSDKGDSYLLHEHLEQVNEPVYFYQFEEQARAHGLQFLGEAHLSAMSQHELPAEVSGTLRRLSSDIVEMEQYLDFLRNRTFRQSLLCHQGIEIDRQPDAARVSKLHVMSSVKPVENLDLSPNTEVTFANRFGTLRTSEPLLKEVLNMLGRTYPRVWPVKEVISQARERFDGEWAAQARADLTATNLIHGDMRGFVALFAYRPVWAERIEPKPEVSSLARWQADGGNMVTSLAHEVVRIDDLERQVLLLCNGQRSEPEVAASIAALMRKGAVILPAEKQGGDPDALTNETLNWLLGSCLLVRRD
jgi:methyltransferase-like protein